MSKLVLLIGRQGSGKSTTFCRLAESLADRSLIIDPGHAKAYANHGFLRVEEVPAFQDASQGKIKRVYEPFDKNEVIASIFGYDFETKQINRRKAFLNGNLFMEDAGSYIDSNLNRKLKACIKAFKQYGLNLYLSYHSIDEVSPDILRLDPHVLILKKTGDLNVFSQIRKARHFGNYQQVLRAFYKAKFAGLDAREIGDAMPEDELQAVARDLQLEGDPAKEICRHANGKLRLTKKDKEQGKYAEEWIILR
jgi:energy-coupling factor transporter ATP-binding protein EcfA2